MNSHAIVAISKFTEHGNAGSAFKHVDQSGMTVRDDYYRTSETDELLAAATILHAAIERAHTGEWLRDAADCIVVTNCPEIARLLRGDASTDGLAGEIESLITDIREMCAEMAQDGCGFRWACLPDPATSASWLKRSIEDALQEACACAAAADEAEKLDAPLLVDLHIRSTRAPNSEPAASGDEVAAAAALMERVRRGLDPHEFVALMHRHVERHPISSS
jgi:hypothetical protein